MFTRMGSAAFKKDLTNITLLCEFLGDPQKALKSIHVGGTNGKGSVSHMLAAVLQTAGYKTGLHTSPHLKDFRERIRINGEMVPEAFVISFVERIQPLAKVIEPSFFEISVAMAFEYFAQQRVDVALIEVGLGGRLDSTNIIQPELSVITNIGWDHMNMLGNTLPEIATEKGGIIKPNTPVIIGEKSEETEMIFRDIAARHNAPIVFAEEEFSVDRFCFLSNGILIDIEKQREAIEQYTLDLPGIYQTKNILTALAAVEVLKECGYDLNKEKIKYALAHAQILTGLQGRWQVIHKKPMVVLEVAHNTNGIEQMLLHLKKLTFQHLHLVIGMVKDKEVESVLKLLPPTATYYFTQAQIPRALPAADLKGKANIFKLEGHTYPDVNAALKTAMQQAQSNDLIMVCGSIFLVAEVEIETLKS